MSALLVSAALAAAIPDPGGGELPPGAEGLLTLLRWAVGIGLTIGVFGVIAVGIAMTVQNRRGEGSDFVLRLGWVFGGVLVISSASALITALV